MANQNDLKSEIGNRVRDFRIKNQYTQFQFAELIDISVNFLSEIENGKKGMSQDTICKLCHTFHISADYLLFGEASTPNVPAPTKLTDYANSLSSADLDLVIKYLTSLKRVRDWEI